MVVAIRMLSGVKGPNPLQIETKSGESGLRGKEELARSKGCNGRDQVHVSGNQDSSVRVPAEEQILHPWTPDIP